MINHLFVYGSLMSGIESPIALFLKNNNHFVGAGKIEGILYDLGKYPGLIPMPKSQRWVKGHVFRLTEPAKSLPILDDYEGSAARFPQPTEYIRAAVQVVVVEQLMDCWVYQYNHAVEQLPQIVSGDYLQYLAENPAYQQFVNSQVGYDRHATNQ